MSEGNVDITVLALAFIAILVMISLVLIFGVFLSKKNKLIQEKYQAELASQQQMHAIELQALRSQMNPHFVHNSLNAIQYYIQRNEVEQSEEYLSKFSKLIRAFFELSRKQTITLEEEVHLLDNYLSIEKLRFEDKLHYEITVDDALEDDTEIPSMLLQPLVENAVNHGIFHKKGSGTIKVQFRALKDEGFQVSVIDDGIGLTAAKELFKKTTKTIENRSTTVLQDRLKLLEYNGKWHIEHRVEELQNPVGTAVHLTFKSMIDHED
jgi:sensor histidine kinase YesM